MFFIIITTITTNNKEIRLQYFSVNSAKWSRFSIKLNIYSHTHTHTYICMRMWECIDMLLVWVKLFLN